MNGTVVNQGYEYDKRKPSGVAVRVQKRLYIVSDGLENASGDHECGGETSTEGYQNYGSDSWQYKLRNKLLSGNINRNIMSRNGLVVDVDMVFDKWLTGLSGFSSESSSFALGVPYAQPTLQQALEFYSGLTEQTGGALKLVTADAFGNLVSRFPGDVDYSGCVSDADYTQILQWYGVICNPDPAIAGPPHCYRADLDGNGRVDDMDYLILVEYWGQGPSC